MKKVVLTFGLIAGAIMSAMLLLTLPFSDETWLENGAILGYTTMVASFLLIYFGVRSYRDNVAGGTVSFGRAFKVGALITVVASLCYVVTWEIIFYNFRPDFMTKYGAHVIAKERAAGATPEQLAVRQAEMDKWAVLYRNPAINAGMTFLEPLPVALLVTLVTAGVLSRRKSGGVTEPAFQPGVGR